MSRKVVYMGTMFMASSASNTSTNAGTSLNLRTAITELDDAESIGVMVQAGGATTEPGLLIEVCMTTQSTGIFTQYLSFPLSTVRQIPTPVYVSSNQINIWPVTFQQIRIATSALSTNTGGFTAHFTKQFQM